jgi:hypothetical protein
MARAPRIRGAALTDRAPQLFLSHSSRDKTWVVGLAQDLNVCGVDVWFDEWELRVGDDLHERIAEAVEKSRFVGVVITKHFSESQWIKGEVHHALSREKAEARTVVLPLLADNVSPPPVLSAKKYLDFADDYFGSLTRLVGTIHGIPPLDTESGIRSLGRPLTDLADCFKVFDYAGHVPLHVVGTEMLGQILNAGGWSANYPEGAVVRFNATEILKNPTISQPLRELMTRLAKLPPQS